MYFQLKKKNYILDFYYIIWIPFDLDLVNWTYKFICDLGYYESNNFG